ncbi:hypothetical protein F442_01177 [Phytophthora nicotianae P10297]|uniref:Uncharacterized protein n=3 Tax=Phytophthora nicotianae TaxID=4792 RepID=W3A636_PHYNI|nr:hypothetical protein L915_01173 [Phytophthora nicotianae]ETL49348.1 hypothetical protein L916_01157 [Phytophthora nicotianae]ETM02403.1 hypothetical protein L917_01127 [Phytophthora nicotianae]ETM55648.1 hypothetical protein L914_01166 [Phytophthora nicotianae]ETP53984.1 hypothetical protein F442_01177 [Phytophthora nicotianae P10297]
MTHQGSTTSRDLRHSNKCPRRKTDEISSRVPGASARKASEDAGTLFLSKKLCFFTFSIGEIHRFRNAGRARATSSPTRSSQLEVMFGIQPPPSRKR